MAADPFDYRIMLYLYQSLVVKLTLNRRFKKKRYNKDGRISKNHFTLNPFYTRRHCNFINDNKKAQPYSSTVHYQIRSFIQSS